MARPASSRNTRLDVLLIEDLSEQRLPARRMQAVLLSAGLSARLIDLDSPAWLALAERARPSLVVFSVLFGDRIAELPARLAHLRAVCPHAHLALAGPLPALSPRSFLDGCPDLDSIIAGEPEATIVDLARAVQRADGIELQSLWTRGRDATDAPHVAVLDALPFPARRDALPGHPFLDGSDRYRFATIEASRGCYHACTFCLPVAFGRRIHVSYRRRSMGNLVSEIRALYRRGARLLLFDDEQFLPPIAHSLREEFVESLRRELRGLKLAFTIKCRPDDVEHDLFSRLKEIGLVRAFVGIESGAEATLALFGKRVTPAQNARALQILSDLGIIADFRILVVHPQTTLSTLADEVDWLDQVLPYIPTVLSFRELELYAGTELASRFGSDGLPVSGYSLCEPRAEFARRVGRLLFGHASLYSRLAEQVSTAWFDGLVQDRITSSGSHAGQGLAAVAKAANRAAIAAWRGLLDCAARADLDAIDESHADVSGLAFRIDAALAPLLEQFHGARRPLNRSTLIERRSHFVDSL